MSDEKLRIAAYNDRQIVPNDKIHSSPLFERQQLEHYIKQWKKVQIKSERTLKSDRKFSFRGAIFSKYAYNFLKNAKKKKKRKKQNKTNKILGNVNCRYGPKVFNIISCYHQIKEVKPINKSKNKQNKTK